MLTKLLLEQIFNRTNGHCHFCGDHLIFKYYGKNKPNGPVGAWEADHVFQKGKGGNKDASNCLPACVKCNRLRWFRTGRQLRELITLGLIAQEIINQKSELGKQLLALRRKRDERTIKRRRKKLV